MKYRSSYFDWAGPVLQHAAKPDCNCTFRDPDSCTRGESNQSDPWWRIHSIFRSKQFIAMAQLLSGIKIATKEPPDSNRRCWSRKVQWIPAWRNWRTTTKASLSGIWLRMGECSASLCSGGRTLLPLIPLASSFFKRCLVEKIRLTAKKMSQTPNMNLLKGQIQFWKLENTLKNVKKYN